MTEAKRTHWRKLDNAAKIFPATSSRRDPRVFRFYCELKEQIESAPLQQALDKTLVKYPLFLSVMRKGFFWYYLEKSDLPAMVKEEKDPPCVNLYIRDRKDLLFQVSYWQNRINFEVFHALTDGTGAIQFITELVKNYLIFRHPQKQLPDLPLTKEDMTIQDLEDDSFSKYYTKQTKAEEKTAKRKSGQISGTKVTYGNLNITEGVVSSSALLKKAKEFGVSITVFLTAVFLCAIHEDMNRHQRKKPLVMMVPVNLRKYFPSASMLNFFGWIEPGYLFAEENYRFDDIISALKKYFEQELTVEQVSRRMCRLMGLERNLLLRIAPLELKNLCLQLALKLGKRDITAIFSNMGVITMPPEYAGYIKRFGVFTSTPKVELCICSFQDEMVFGFASAYQKTNIERNFFRILKGFGIETDLLKDRYPEQKKPEYKGLKFFQWFSFSCITAAVVACMANIIFTPEIFWSPFVIGGAFSMWTALAIGFYKRHNLLKNGVWQMIIVTAVSVIWDRSTGWRGWSIDYVLPFACLLILLSLWIISKIQKLSEQEYMIYYIIVAIFGLIPLLLLGLGIVHTAYPSVICGGISFLFLIGLLIFKGKDLFSELSKKLHF